MTDTEDKQETQAPSLGRRALSYGKDAAIVLAVFLSVSWWQQRHLVPVGDAAVPELSLVTLDGERITSESLEGKAVQLHFWATWCGVCRQEFDTLEGVYQGLDPSERLVTVVLGSGSEQEIRRFVAERGLSYPIAIGTDAMAAQWRVKSFPTNYYLNPKLEVASRDVGLATGLGMRIRLWWAGLGL